MIRNLLYSLCLHILFILIFFFNDNINNAINKKITSINTFNIDAKFLEENKIKTTKEDLFSNLSLQEKIKLYKLSKELQNKNSVLPVINTTKAEVIQMQTDAIKNVLDKNKEISGGYVLYLGPTDYNRLLQKQQAELEEKERIKQEEIKKQQKEEKDKLENIIASVSVDTIIEKLDKEVSNNTQKTENIVKNEVKQEVKTIQKKEEQKIDITPANIDNSILLNIDVDKIFTKEDIKQIKDIIKTEQYNFGLSTRERISVQNQLISCYKNALVQTGKKSVVKTSVTIKLFMDGIIDSKEIKIKVIDDENRFSTEDYEVAMNNAKIALAYCNPIRNLPRTKYQNWQNINFVFDIVE